MTTIGIDTELAQYAFNVMLLGLGILVRDIAHMQDNVGLDDFLKRGAEGRHQHGRQIRDETDGVRQHGLAAVRQRQRTQRRIERCKQHIRRLHVCAGQPIEQCRLASVGVTDQRNHAVRHALTSGAMETACRLNLLEFVFDPGDPFADHAAVGFDLRFAGAAHESEAAALTLKVGP